MGVDSTCWAGSVRERLVRIPQIKISEPNRVKLGAIDAELVSRTVLRDLFYPAFATAHAQ